MKAMKKMKTIVTVMLLMVANLAIGQQKEIDLFTVPLSNPGKAGKLELDQISGSISVTGYEGKEVIVKVLVMDGGNSSNTTKNGMKRIGSSGLNISAEESNNVVEIDNEVWNRKTDFEIKVPYNFSLKLSTVNNGDVEVSGVTGDMEISNVNGSITLENVEGAVSADTTNGVVKVDFKTIDNSANMVFSSFNGNVEVIFPKTLKANIKAKSDMGDVYTDFDMVLIESKPEVDKRQGSGSYKVTMEQWVRGKINGGGPELLFKTFNGDILIKAK